MRLVFTRSARKHKVGRASAIHVLQTVEPVREVGASREGQDYLTWKGPDERGRVLEIVAVDRGDDFLIFHVMPDYK